MVAVVLEDFNCDGCMNMVLVDIHRCTAHCILALPFPATTDML